MKKALLAVVVLLVIASPVMAQEPPHCRWWQWWCDDAGSEEGLAASLGDGRKDVEQGVSALCKICLKPNKPLLRGWTQEAASSAASECGACSAAEVEEFTGFKPGE
jgi:hypothetical protein